MQEFYYISCHIEHFFSLNSLFSFTVFQSPILYSQTQYFIYCLFGNLLKHHNEYKVVEFCYFLSHTPSMWCWACSSIVFTEPALNFILSVHMKVNITHNIKNCPHLVQNFRQDLTVCLGFFSIYYNCFRSHAHTHIGSEDTLTKQHDHHNVASHWPWPGFIAEWTITQTKKRSL